MQTPVSSNPPSSLASGSSSEYRVGRGPFGATTGRPTTPSNGARSIDDIRRKTIKFHLPEEGASRTFDLTDYEDGVKVLEKVLRKFGKLSSGTQSDVEADTVESDEIHGGLVVDGWGVFLTRGNDDSQGK
jgi:mitogen-activated protein kinase kinase kinase